MFLTSLYSLSSHCHSPSVLGSSKNGPPFTFVLFDLQFFFLQFFSFFIFLFFYLPCCLWFDLHRHLFLLVLFLLCGCVYNQEMEIQKSTCCHSKYVLFHLLATLPIIAHPSMFMFAHLPCFSLHGFSSRFGSLSKLTCLLGFEILIWAWWGLFQSSYVFLFLFFIII